MYCTIPTYNENNIISNNILKSILNCYSDATVIYTDASKSGEGSGCAYFLPSGGFEFKYKLPNEFSIFSAESLAILEALKYIKNSYTKKTLILSDCLSVLQNIKNTFLPKTFSNPYIFLIKDMLKQLEDSGFNIKFIWVNAHIGLKDNEYVDYLAKSSITSGTLLSYSLSVSDVITIFKRNQLSIRKDQWNLYCLTKPTRYTTLQPVIPQNTWFKSFKAPRKYITTINRLRFGHACYPSHLYKINVIEDNNCKHCGKQGDLDHIFFECTKFQQHSNSLYKNLIKLDMHAPFNIQSLLATGSQQIYNIIIDFLSDTRTVL
uniref:Uncharacterized protein LOC114325765 n=1 Tax=Diabrotica virgifera virgifera TaxID=50390 RepID=A0A6P7F497_DIAVI